jgi:hypothetical protein
MIKIFNDSDSAAEILERVVEFGVAGIAGMRTAVRNRLGEIRTITDSQSVSEVFTSATLNHPWAELAIVFDEGLYTFREAKQEVVDAYDRLLAEEAGVEPRPTKL